MTMSSEVSMRSMTRKVLGPRPRERPDPSGAMVSMRSMTRKVLGHEVPVGDHEVDFVVFQCAP